MIPQHFATSRDLSGGEVISDIWPCHFTAVANRRNSSKKLNTNTTWSCFDVASGAIDTAKRFPSGCSAYGPRGRGRIRPDHHACALCAVNEPPAAVYDATMICWLGVI